MAHAADLVGDQDEGAEQQAADHTAHSSEPRPDVLVTAADAPIT
jgi:hypothetical protein